MNFQALSSRRVSYKVDSGANNLLMSIHQELFSQEYTTIDARYVRNYNMHVLDEHLHTTDSRAQQNYIVR